MNYHYSLRNNPEDNSSRLLRSGSLKSQTKHVGIPPGTETIDNIQLVLVWFFFTDTL